MNAQPQRHLLYLNRHFPSVLQAICYLQPFVQIHLPCFCPASYRPPTSARDLMPSTLVSLRFASVCTSPSILSIPEILIIPSNTLLRLMCKEPLKRAQFPRPLILPFLPISEIRSFPYMIAKFSSLPISVLGGYRVQGPKGAPRISRARWRQKMYQKELHHHHNHRYITKER